MVELTRYRPLTVELLWTAQRAQKGLGRTTDQHPRTVSAAREYNTQSHQE